MVNYWRLANSRQQRRKLLRWPGCSCSNNLIKSLSFTLLPTMETVVFCAATPMRSVMFSLGMLKISKEGTGPTMRCPSSRSQSNPFSLNDPVVMIKASKTSSLSENKPSIVLLLDENFGRKH